MKRAFLGVGALSLAIGLMAGGALAGDFPSITCPWTPVAPGPAEVSGSGSVLVKDIHGTPATGGVLCGTAGFSFEAAKGGSAFLATSPSGSGEATGGATGGSVQLPNLAKSENALGVGALATASPGLMGTGAVSVEGKASQETQARLPGVPCCTGAFGTAENQTQAAFEASRTSGFPFGTLTAQGTAGAEGTSLVQRLPTAPGAVKAELLSQGASEATSSKSATSESAASGEGEAQGGANLVLPGNWGVASGAGEAGYQAAGPSAASGAFTITGAFGGAKVDGNVVQLDAKVTVSSQAQGSIPSGPAWPWPSKPWCPTCP